MNIPPGLFVITAAFIVLLAAMKAFFWARETWARRGKSRMQALAERIGFTLRADWDYSLDHAILDFMQSTRSTGLIYQPMEYILQ